MARVEDNQVKGLEVLILDKATGQLKNLQARRGPGQQKQWVYADSNNKPVARLSRNSETDRIDIAASKSFTGVVRIQRRNMLNNPVANAYDDLKFEAGHRLPQEPSHAQQAISQVGKIEPMSTPLSQLTPQPTFAISPLNRQVRHTSQASRGVRTF